MWRVESSQAVEGGSNNIATAVFDVCAYQGYLETPGYPLCIWTKEVLLLLKLARNKQRISPHEVLNQVVQNLCSCQLEFCRKLAWIENFDFLNITNRTQPVSRLHKVNKRFIKPSTGKLFYIFEKNWAIKNKLKFHNRNKFTVGMQSWLPCGNMQSEKNNSAFVYTEQNLYKM